MRVNINSVHFKADKKLLAFINDRIEKLGVYYDGLIGSEVSLKLDNSDARDNKIAEIRLIIPGYDLFAKKQSKSLNKKKIPLVIKREAFFCIRAEFFLSVQKKVPFVATGRKGFDPIKKKLFLLILEETLLLNTKQTFFFL